MDEGTLAGFPLLDVKVTLTDGGYHPVDSSAIAYELAGSISMPACSAKWAVQYS